MERSGTLQQIGEFVLARVGLLKKASSFAAVGVVNTMVDFAIFAAAVKLLHLPLIPANLMSWCVAVSCSYVLNSYTTFAVESGRQLRARAYGKFLLSGLAGLLANTTALVLASFFLPVLLAKVAAIGVSFFVNFTLSHLVVFGRHPHPQHVSRDKPLT